MTESVPPKKRGCLFYGCLTLFLIGLLAIGVIYLGYRFVARLIADYTDTAPEQIETVTVTSDELAALQKRLGAFKEALEAQKVPQELILTARDLNALIADNRDLKNRLFVMIESDRIKGRISLPLTDIGFLKLKGRYLNAMAGFKVSLANGTMNVAFDTVEVKGKPLPAWLLSRFRQQNLAQDLERNPQNAENIRKFDSIQIKDGSVILKNKLKE